MSNVKIKKLYELTSDLYIQRLVNGNSKNITKEGNWRLPNNSDRWDHFISKYFPNRRRCYFHVSSRFTNSYQNFETTLMEASSQNFTCEDSQKYISNAAHESWYELKYALVNIDKLSKDVLTNYTFIDFSNVPIYSKEMPDELLYRLETTYDLSNVDKFNVCAILCLSKYYNETTCNINSPEYNLIVFENNPLYDSILRSGIERFIHYN